MEIALVLLTHGVIVLLILSAACAPEYSGKTPPPIVDGTMDLTGWDFEADGPAPLLRLWETSGMAPEPRKSTKKN